MSDDTAVERKLSHEEAEQMMHRVMQRQAKLSLSVAAVFISILILLPLINLYGQSFAQTQVFGFTLTWLFLGVLFYPITWILSNYFVKNSDRIEAEIVQEETRA